MDDVYSSVRSARRLVDRQWVRTCTAENRSRVVGPESSTELLENTIDLLSFRFQIQLVA